jgi:hypothetical protein
MSTGIETWNQNLLDIGPMYPFPGTEVLWVLIGLATWIIWHLIQLRMENSVYDEEDQLFTDKQKLATAMEMSAAQTLVEELKTHGGNFKR